VQGLTPLHTAAHCNKVAVVEHLLKKSADVEAKDKVHSYAAAPTIFHPLPTDCIRTLTPRRFMKTRASNGLTTSVPNQQSPVWLAA
jgi:hypothetical protein